VDQPGLLFSQVFDRHLLKSDLPTIRLHDVRHTHASIQLKQGVALKVVSERLGHSNPAFTLSVYQHVLPGMQADAAKASRQQSSVDHERRRDDRRSDSISPPMCYRETSRRRTRSASETLPRPNDQRTHNFRTW